MEFPERTDSLVKTISAGLDNSPRGAYLWVGAGLSIPAGYPGFPDLAKILLSKTRERIPDNLEPQDTIDAFVKANGAGYFVSCLADIFTPKKPLPYHLELMKLPWKGIITTNYDELLEDALKEIGKGYIKIILERNLDLTAREDIPLYKIHGDVSEFDRMILDTESYEKYSDLYSFLESDLHSILRKYSIVFFGYSMRDPRLLVWLNSLGKGGRARLMISYTVMVESEWDSIPADEKTLLEEANIKPVLLESYDQIPLLISHLVDVIVPKDTHNIHFKLSFASDKRDKLKIEPSIGKERTVDSPWMTDNNFIASLMDFNRMADRHAADDERGWLNSCAVRIGKALGTALLTDDDRQCIKNATGSTPIVTIESDDDLILSLPWELIRMGDDFAVKEGKFDLVRTAPAKAQNPITLTPPDRLMKLVINVSAPEGQLIGNLDYEAESYRISKALYEYTETVFTELGTLDDMADTVAENEPIGVHFSGHGAPGFLLFEDDEGKERLVPINELISEIRKKASNKLPRFFYLASCHGNDPGDIEEGKAGSTISSAQLHREGVTQVIGYYGPIIDELSTMAEVAIYHAIADGQETRYGVRQARSALSKGSISILNPMHKRGSGQELIKAFPFAWAQIVLYHRGIDYPLSREIPSKHIQDYEAKLQRTFRGIDRRILSTGFIGRRRELHKFRSCLDSGQRTFVFQGLGGLGKSTIALHALYTLQMLVPKEKILTIWCQDMEKSPDQAMELIKAVSDFGSRLFGPQWVEVSASADRIPETPKRFAMLLNFIMNSTPGIVIYLDNVESLMEGPDNEEPDALGRWKSQELANIWQLLKLMCGENLCVIGSCRYRNKGFDDCTIPVPEMGDNAIFRMMGWFDGLRSLSLPSRAKLVSLVHGHPRMVEFLDDLIKEALIDWKNDVGEWDTPSNEDVEAIKREWDRIIAPAIPKVEDRLEENLLLDKIWENVLDDKCRRMLFRMTLLLRPYDWEMMLQLGENGENESETSEIARELKNTSLVVQLEDRNLEGKLVNLYELHPMTAKFISKQFDEMEANALKQETYLRIGAYLEKQTKTSLDLRVRIDAGQYLFLCREYDRAFELLGSASQWLRQRGMVRAGIALLERFESSEVVARMDKKLCGQMLGIQGLAYYSLGQAEKSIVYYHQTLEIAKEIKDKAMEGATLGNLGLVYSDLGEVEKAIGYYQQALDIDKETGDRKGEGADLGNLGGAYSDLGQVEKAIRYYQQALEIAREIGDKRGEGNGLGSLGGAYSDLGQMEKAIGYYQQALEIAREIGDRRSEGTWLGNLGNVYLSLGQVEKAVGYYQQALEIAREIGDRRNEGKWLGNLGSAYATLGQVEKARAYLNQALAIAREIKDPRIEASALSNLERLK
jgi:tetratricopeptide (TPR) repeat protein